MSTRHSDCVRVLQASGDFGSGDGGVVREMGPTLKVSFIPRLLICNPCVFVSVMQLLCELNCLSRRRLLPSSPFLHLQSWPHGSRQVTERRSRQREKL